MLRIEELKIKIDQLYLQKNEGRAEWADWLHGNHVFVVADNADRLAERFGAKKDLSVAAAMLHDVADAVMSRFDPCHTQESERISKSLLEEVGFSQEEVYIIVDDAIAFHGCQNGAPKSLEGRVMAAADAMAHLQTSFYAYGVATMRKAKSIDDVKEWAMKKIERDFRAKITFPEVQKELQIDYERQKAFINTLC